jgi:squalene-associated FAD-dependent desaturase
MNRDRPRAPKFHRPRPPHVAIVGGGLAGLAAAVALQEVGLRISLFESRPRLGGRAGSFPDPALGGKLVDTCQHVTLACCTNLADFCRRTAIDTLFRTERSYRFIGPDGRVSHLHADRLLPAPLHLTTSFLAARYLSWPDRLRVARGFASLVRERGQAPPVESFADWLWRHGQNVRTINRFWSIVLISALNARPEDMDVGHARQVLVDGFLRHRRAFEMSLPLVPLAELYDGRVGAWLADHDIAIHRKTGVRSVLIDDDGMLEGLLLRDGTRVPADFVVAALPAARTLDLLGPALLARLPDLDGMARSITVAPITGVHLWFDRPVCPFRHAAIVGRLSQWVFDQTALRGDDAVTPGVGQYLQVVISASFDLQPMTNDQVIAAVLDDLAALWPVTREARLAHHRVVTEHAATFGVEPGIERRRPPQRTPIDGLFLAGDWTATGWPATMEGAVRSGYLAAEQVLRDLHNPHTFLRPDLPDSTLTRALLGRRAPSRTGNPPD